MSAPQRPPLGILMLAGKMSLEPGCMACEATFPYPVLRHVVAGSATPRTADDARALLPLYVRAAGELERRGVAAITANCGLIALMQEELARTVSVPVVTSALLVVPLLARLLPGRRIGILTFFTDAVGEANYRACGWSGEAVPIALGGVGESEAWLEFLRTKEVPAALRPRLEHDLVASASALRRAHPDLGAFVSECTMLPTCLEAVRRELGLPVFDILTTLDLAMSGSWRPPAARASAAGAAP